VDAPGSPTAAETTRFLTPGDRGTTPATPPDALKEPELRRQPAAERARVEAPPPEAPSPSPGPPARAEPARRLIRFQAPQEVPRRPAPDIPVIAPPMIESLPAAPPTGLTSVLVPAPVPLAAPATPPRSATPPPTASPTTSGRIIWTGKLTKNGRLVVERNHASSGAINGALPAAAARVSAYPGDLTAAGITLFTADLRYSKPLTEKAGAENGWNPTTYTWDPKRAAGIKVVEQPGPQNGYKLVLESEMPKLSVLMLEWHATQ